MEIDLQLVDINGGIQMAIKDRGNITGAMKGGGAVNIEDVFSTYVYTGTGTTQNIVNGIDLATDGGMVWSKRRDSATWHNLTDTDRGATNVLFSNETTADTVDANGLTSFNLDGFSIGSSNGVNAN